MTKCFAQKYNIHVNIMLETFAGIPLTGHRDPENIPENPTDKFTATSWPHTHTHDIIIIIIINIVRQ